MTNVIGVILTRISTEYHVLGMVLLVISGTLALVSVTMEDAHVSFLTLVRNRPVDLLFSGLRLYSIIFLP